MKIQNNKETIVNELNNIQGEIALLYTDFVDCKIYTFDGAEEHLNEYNRRQNSIANNLVDVLNEINSLENEKDGEDLYIKWDELNAAFLSAHQELYTKLNSVYLSKMSEQIKKTNIKLENSLGTQFGIFSALLSLLAFILNNTKLFGIEGLTFNHIIIINLCYLLACTVIFCLVFSFIKPYYHTVGRVWSFIVLIAIIAATVCFCYVKFPNIPIIPLCVT